MKHLIAAATLLASPALAELTQADPDQLSALISSKGYPVEQGTDDIGDPQLVVKSEGTAFYIQFYGCGEDHLNCTSVQFLAAFDMADGMTAEQALGWSRDQRFTSVYLDDEQDPFLQMDMNIDGGVSEANFTDNLEIWRSSLSAFKDYIDW